MAPAGEGGEVSGHPPGPHLFIIYMKPAVYCHRLRLVYSSPFNLCHSHTLPFCPTSNPYSPLSSSRHAILPAPYVLPFRTRDRRGKTAICGDLLYGIDCRNAESPSLRTRFDSSCHQAEVHRRVNTKTSR
ncbi:hypothetical protein D4764_20G0007210 [Takifugu flavidus]|uniref:Uncharacterized protein n=1 Tax=Takifugu flavidus TaxID=433684 RepID=A0A5C6NJ94_9TELE|nr:hypothetical protein D4764_20G0007210 [Takifugu flavidus]